MFGFSKREKLEKQLMADILSLAEVKYFPIQDAEMISRLVSTYNSGDTDLIQLGMSACYSTLEQYPKLFDEWDNLLIRYHELGLFPKWHIKA